MNRRPEFGGIPLIIINTNASQKSAWKIMAYETKNACSQTPSLLSIFTALLYLIQLVLHSVFAVPGIVKID